MDRTASIPARFRDARTPSRGRDTDTWVTGPTPVGSLTRLGGVRSVEQHLHPLEAGINGGESVEECTAV